MSAEIGPISPERLRQLLVALGVNAVNLDVALSTRASEATLLAGLVSISAQLDVALSTRATEATVLALKTQNIPYTVKSDKDTHFVTAIAVDAKEDADLVGLIANKLKITNVEIQAKENKHYVLWFWSKDTKSNVDLDLDAHKGTVDLDLSVNEKRIGGAGQYYMDVSDVNLYYIDEDATNELHVSLQNLGVGAKSVGVAGELRVLITYLPLA